MPHLLESGKLQLWGDEAGNYRAAAECLHETCELALDLTQAITVEDRIFLEVANAALADDLGLLEGAIAKVEAAIQLRTQTA